MQGKISGYLANTGLCGLIWRPLAATGQRRLRRAAARQFQEEVFQVGILGGQVVDCQAGRL